MIWYKLVDGKIPAARPRDAPGTLPAHDSGAVQWLPDMERPDSPRWLWPGLGRAGARGRAGHTAQRPGASAGLDVGQGADPEGDADRSPLSQSLLCQRGSPRPGHAKRERQARFGARSVCWPNAQDGQGQSARNHALPEGPRIHASKYLPTQWLSDLPGMSAGPCPGLPDAAGCA